MNKVYRHFYRDFFYQTGGFIPLHPFGQAIYPGDFFQIKNREIVILGNIYLNQLIGKENCAIGEARPLNENSWSLEAGVSRPFTKKEGGEDELDGKHHHSRQVLSFTNAGSYIFKGKQPESIAINNWQAIKDSLILKLTMTNFSFRDVYVVTESATADSWALTIAGSDKAEVEIRVDEGDGIAFWDLFGHHSSRTVETRDLVTYHHEKKRIPTFFKARKLSIKTDGISPHISDLANKRQGVYEWANDFFGYDFAYHRAGVSPLVSGNTEVESLDLLGAGQLNMNTVLDYFYWKETGPEDFNRLFGWNEGIQ